LNQQLQRATFPPPPPYGFSVNSILGASSSATSLSFPISSSLSEQSQHPFQSYRYRNDGEGCGIRSPLDDIVLTDGSSTFKLVRPNAAHRSQTVRPFWIQQQQQQHPHQSSIDGENGIDDHDPSRRRPGSPTELVALQPVSVDHGDGEAAVDDRACGGSARYTVGGAGLSSATMAHEASDDGRYGYKMSDGGLAEGAEWTMSATGQMARYYGHSQLDPLGNYMLDHCK